MAANAMQIVSEANCDLMDNVQLISDKLWLEKRDTIAGPTGEGGPFLVGQSIASRVSDLLHRHRLHAGTCEWGNRQPVGVRRASVGEYLQCELLTDEDIDVY